ncbi:MAG TPA: LytTR family DNA-binding domain-containing protein [Candidatus Butyricicoccus avistercoris]|uniref:Stage 0 sporulation protein A homolog n=1 Tax=Candidatus Butyricicoccus avistercoris TaxID=2838518 RepID=A0A9D1TI38_9FIRM|nr:LytTR family DNA-binding domain-containing protein [Candidatus Butyricicoccus avistercoris]
MKIAVCDDDKYSLNETINLLKQYNQISKFELDVIGFNNGDDMIESLKKHGDCQIYILDIIMKEKNGIQIAEILRKLKYNGEIIFLTNSNAFAAESYNVGAFNYILKPLDKNKLFDILDTAIKKIEQKQSSFIVISTKSGLCKLPLDDIVYAEKFGRIIRYHCKNDVVIDSLTLKTNFKEANAILLQNNKFSLCGASFVINLECVTNIQGQTLTLYNKEKLTIPRNISTSFKSLWGKYWLNEV